MDFSKLNRCATSKKTYWIIKCSVCLAPHCCVSLHLFIDFDFIIGFCVSLLYGLPMRPEGKFILIKFSIRKISTETNQQTSGIVNIVKRQMIMLLSCFYLETNSLWLSCCYLNGAFLPWVCVVRTSSKASGQANIKVLWNNQHQGSQFMCTAGDNVLVWKQ